MCSETLQFGICNDVRVRSETLQFFASKIAIASARSSKRTYVRACVHMHVNVNVS